MITRPIRVLHIVGSMDFGGVETWLNQMWRVADRSLFHYDFGHISAHPGAYAPEIESLGGRMVHLPLDSKRPWKFSRIFRDVLRERRYDIIHSHVHHFSGYIMRLAAKEGVPVRIAHSHNTSDGRISSLPRKAYRAFMQSWISRYATCGLAVSREAAAALFGASWQEDPRFQVLYCGIDLEPFLGEVNRDEIRNEWSIPADTLVMGHVGRFRPQKNHAFLLQISAEVFKLRPNSRLLLVGDGPELPMIKRTAAQLGIEKNVIFAGARSDVPRLLQGAIDVFLLPSHWEGLPIASLEAQAVGLPMLISDVVTKEAVVIPNLIQFIPLGAGPLRWAQVALQAFDKGRMPRESAWKEVQDSAFSIRNSARNLESVYRTALER